MVTPIENSTFEDLASFDPEALSRNTVGDVDLQREVLQLFYQQVGEMLQNLGNSKTDQVWYQSAHAIKGSACSIGLLRLGQLAEEAEGLMGCANTSQRRAQYVQMKNEAEQARLCVVEAFPGIFN